MKDEAIYHQRRVVQTGNRLIDQIYRFFPITLTPDSVITLEAARRISNILFAMTWITERLTENMKSNLPDNLVFTGYLKIHDSNELFAKFGVAISLTVRQELNRVGLRKP